MATLEVSDQTMEKIKKQFNIETGEIINSFDEMIGKKYFFRTVTYHLIGKVVRKFESIICLEKACWVADSGRFTQAIKNGELDEVEILGNWYLNVDTVTDFGPWAHDLPTKQK